MSSLRQEESVGVQTKRVNDPKRSGRRREEKDGERGGPTGTTRREKGADADQLPDSRSSAMGRPAGGSGSHSLGPACCRGCRSVGWSQLGSISPPRPLAGRSKKKRGSIPAPHGDDIGRRSSARRCDACFRRRSSVWSSTVPGAKPFSALAAYRRIHSQPWPGVDPGKLLSKR